MPKAPPSSAPRYVRGAILVGYESLARSCGLDPAAALRQVGLGLRDARQPDQRLRAGRVFRLLELSAQAARRADFGLLLPVGRRLSYLGDLGLRMREQPTVRRALRDMTAHMKLHSTCVSLRLAEGADWAELRMTLHADGELAIRQGTEAALAGLLHVLRIFLGSTWKPLRAHFVHSKPPDVGTHHWLFACPLAFSAPWNGLTLRPADLDREIPLSDAGFSGYAGASRGRAAAAEVVDAWRVRQSMLALLEAGACNADAVAASLGIHRRTLHRILVREGLTYLTVLQDLRRELAQQYLRSRMPVTDVAGWLGFGDGTAFSRWCRHHLGASPRALRADAG